MIDEIFEKELKEQWKHITFSNNFLFWKILTTYPDVCKELIGILLGREIERISIPENEKTMAVNPESRGIRLDVFAKNVKESFDLEIQVVDKQDLPERSRYYQGVIDVDSLRTGHPYTELRASYILFICLFDPFGEGLPCYSFENVCTEKNSLRLNDRAYKIFYNAKSCATMGDNESLQNFLEFVGKGRASDEFTGRLKSLVEKARNDIKWRQHYMTLEVMKTYERMDGIKIGREQGARENAEQNAINALHENISPEIIARITSLPLERVAELARSINK